MKVFIPSMSSGIGDIKHPTDIIKYIIRHYIYSPKNINDTFRDMEISFNYDASVTENDKDLMCSRVETSLSSVFTRYFVDASSVDVTAEHIAIDEKAYAIKISVVIMIDGEVYSIDGSISVNSDGSVDFKIGQ